ncbi:MAG: DUF4178 domain-containing protein [Desulfobacteraceae bacterium]|jgi:hypothetical protein
MALNTYTEPDYVLTLREQLRLVRNMPVIPEGGAKAKKAITALTKGDYLRFNGVIYLVEEKSEYREGKWKWHELHLMDLVTGHQTFLEYEQDDRLEAAVWESGELELSDIGLTAKKLDVFDDDEQGSFVFDGTTYAYEESDKAFWKKGTDAEEIPFYYWDFAEKKGKKLLSVEKWDDGSFDVSTGTEIDPRAVVYLATGATQE